MRPLTVLFAAALLCASACQTSEPAKQATSAKTPAAAAAKPATAAAPAAPSAPAQSAAQGDAKAASAPLSRADRLEALEKEHNDATQAYYKLFEDAKTDEERKKVAETARPPDPKTWAPRFWEIARETPADDVSLQALQWLAQQTRDKEERQEALSAVERDHLKSEKLSDLCDWLGYGRAGKTPLLEKIAAQNPSREVQGHACYALAKLDLSSIDSAQRIQKGPDADTEKDLKEWLGEDRYAELSKLDVAKAQAEAESLLERVAADYADVKTRRATLGEQARGDLHEIKDLAVGKPAPEIAAEDVGGVAFKLSDYRGKVVMLDFWGNW